jgi:hypothetical protein
MSLTTPSVFRAFFALCFFMLSQSKGEIAVVHVAIEGNVRFPVCEGCPRMVNGRLAIRSFCVTEKGNYESEVWFSFTSLEHEIAPMSGGISVEIDDEQVGMVTCSTGAPSPKKSRHLGAPLYLRNRTPVDLLAGVVPRLGEMHRERSAQ